jgi:hypothetical protein
MKKKLIIRISVIIIVLVGASILISFFVNKNTLVSIVETDNCNNKAKLIYTDGDRNIYTYCLDSVMIESGNHKIDLKDYIDNNDKATNEIISSLKLKDSLFDGGTQIYKGNITLIKCNSLDGNKDIYIGNKDMIKKENFCKNDNSTFVKTYTVEKIKEYKEQQYQNGIPVTYGNSFEVTLRQFQAETKTVIINNIWDKLKENTTYEFEFMLYHDAANITDDIEYIFKNCTIVEIRETDKIGLEQTQDSIK